MSTLNLFFAWPAGSVWSNLLASIIWIVPSFLYARFHVKKLHHRIDELHAKHDILRKQLRQETK